MGNCYLSRRNPFAPKYELLNCVYPIDEDGMPMGEVIIPSGVVTLSKYICSENSKVTGIQLPITVLNFEDECFKNSKNLVKVGCPDKLQEISKDCFLNCSSLEEIYLPKALTTIKSSAFENCTALKVVLFNDNAVTFDVYDRAFYNCTQLTNEDINYIAKNMTPKGQQIFSKIPLITDVIVNQIYDYMFEDDEALQRVTILKADANGVVGKSITDSDQIRGSYPFKRCFSLKEVVLPENTKEIGEYLFVVNSDSLKSNNLEKINIPNGCQKIKTQAFYKCEKLENLSIPKTIEEIGAQAFQGADLRNLIIEEGFQGILKNLAFSQSYINDAAVNELCKSPIKNINNIFEQQFSACNNLKEINISRSAPSMFRDCLFLKKATINGSQNLQTIYESMFEGCTSLNEVILNNYINTIGTKAFKDCPNLHSFSSNNTNMKVYSVSLFENSGLEKIKLDNSTTTIEEKSFYNCQKLKAIQLNNILSTYGNSCFDKCSLLKTTNIENNEDNIFTITNGVKTLGNRVFAESGIEKIIFPSKEEISANNVTFGDEIFKDCKDLKEVTLPLNLTSFGTDIFAGCTSLNKVSNSQKVINREYLFQDCVGFTEFDIPSGSQIGIRLFSNCLNLQRVFIPINVTWGSRRQYTTGSSSEYYYSNSSNVISWHNGKNWINENLYAFYNCPKLTNIQLGAGWAQYLDLSPLPLTLESIKGILENLKPKEEFTNNTTIIFKFGENNLSKIPPRISGVGESEQDPVRLLFEARSKGSDNKGWIFQ